MTTIFDHATRLRRMAETDAPRVAHIVRRCWNAFQNWRIERTAIVQLSAMSDRELRDIGLDRSKIGFVVKGRLVHRHHRRS